MTLGFAAMILTDAALGDASLPDTSGVEGISTGLRPLWTMGGIKAGLRDHRPRGWSLVRLIGCCTGMQAGGGEWMPTGGSRGGRLRPAAGRTVDYAGRRNVARPELKHGGDEGANHCMDIMRLGQKGLGAKDANEVHNHNWVEVWDGATGWSFPGAEEYDPRGPNR